MAEELLIPEIIKGCEEAIEDAGDAALSWLGFTTSLTLSSATVTETSTETEYLCGKDTCGGSCARRRDAYAAAVPTEAWMPTRTNAPKLPPKVPLSEAELERRTISGYGSMSQPATGDLDSWFSNVWENEKVYELTHDSAEDESTARYQVFSDVSFYMGTVGMFGCTSIMMMSKYGAYLVRSFLLAFLLYDVSRYLSSTLSSLLPSLPK